MKNSILKNYLIMTLVSLALASCDKEPKSSIPAVSYSSPNDFNLKMMPATQSFTIDAAKRVKITTKSGSNFYFDPGSFYNGSGSINAGNIDVKIIEVNKTHEMMATGAGTESVNGLLASAGMFKIEAFQNGMAVNLAKNKPIKVEIPANDDASITGFKIFKGTENPSKDKVIWDDSGKDSLNFGQDSLRLEKSGQKQIFTFNLNFLTWCNLDRYLNATGGESIRVKISGDYGNLNTNVYIAFTLSGGGPKGMAKLFSDQVKEEWNSSNYNLPYNDKFTIIVTAINLTTKQLEYGIMEIIHTPGQVYTFTKLTPISEADLEAKFKALN